MSRRNREQEVEEMLEQLPFTEVTGLHGTVKNEMLSLLVETQGRKIHGLRTQTRNMARGYERKIKRLERRLERQQELIDTLQAKVPNEVEQAKQDQTIRWAGLGK
jgi:hypothetical protein